MRSSTPKKKCAEEIAVAEKAMSSTVVSPSVAQFFGISSPRNCSLDRKELKARLRDSSESIPPKGQALVATNFSPAQLKKGGHTALALKKGGFDCRSVRMAGFSTASVYFTYTVGSLLFAAPIVDILGSKKSLSLGFFMYVLYMLAFVLGTLHDISDKTRLQWGIVISGSILGGFGSAIVW